MCLPSLPGPYCFSESHYDFLDYLGCHEAVLHRHDCSAACCCSEGPSPHHCLLHENSTTEIRLLKVQFQLRMSSYCFMTHDCISQSRAELIELFAAVRRRRSPHHCLLHENSTIEITSLQVRFGLWMSSCCFMTH